MIIQSYSIQSLDKSQIFQNNTNNVNKKEESQEQKDSNVDNDKSENQIDRFQKWCINRAYFFFV